MYARHRTQVDVKPCSVDLTSAIMSRCALRRPPNDQSCHLPPRRSRGIESVWLGVRRRSAALLHDPRNQRLRRPSQPEHRRHAGRSRRAVLRSDRLGHDLERHGRHPDRVSRRSAAWAARPHHASLPLRGRGHLEAADGSKWAEEHADHRLVWFEDDLRPDARRWAEQRRDTFLVQPSPDEGITQGQLDQVESFLSAGEASDV